MAKKILTGSEIVIECLKEQGVDTVFGYPGGAILNVYDALYKHQDEITHVLTSHEQGAAHAADGYARATGKVGVCYGYIRSRCNKPGNRNCNCIYGFRSDGCDYLQMSDVPICLVKTAFRRLTLQVLQCRSRSIALS